MALATLPENPTAPVLGTTEGFIVLASQTITGGAGSTLSNGNMGIFDTARSYYTGFTPMANPQQFTQLSNGLTYAYDDVPPFTYPVPYASTTAFINQIRTDLTTAYNFLAAGTNLTAPVIDMPTELGGLTLTRGFYKNAVDTAITTPLHLDAQGDPNSVWIFSTAGKLTTGSTGNIILDNGAQAKNVYWRTAGLTAIAANTTFYGNIFAATQINLITGASVTGRLFALSDQVTLQTNTVTYPTATVKDITLTAENFNTNSGSDYNGATVGYRLDGTDAGKIVSASIILYDINGNKIAENTSKSAAKVNNTLQGPQYSSAFLVKAGTYSTSSTWNFDANWIPKVNIVPTRVVITLIDQNGISYIADNNTFAASEPSHRTWTSLFATVAPIITRIGDSNIKVDYNSTYSDAGATALDAADVNLTSLIVRVNPVNTLILGTYTVTYDVNDSSGNHAVQVNRTVNVVDRNVPVITLTGANPQTIEKGTSYSELGATVTDNYSSGLIADTNISDVNTNNVGSYTVKYNAVDSSGNQAVEVNRTINVIDTKTPIITNATTVSNTSATLGVTFDELTTSKYTTNLDKNYDTITDMNATSAATSANWSLTGLNAATVYTYNVWSRDLFGNDNNRIITFTTKSTTALSAVNLGTAGIFAVLAKSAITAPGSGLTSVIGNIGISPAAASYITDLGLIMDSSNTFSTSSLITGKIYAADYTAPTPSVMTTAISDMETAYTDAAGRTLPDYTEIGAGNIGGMTLAPGLYKWGTGVTIPTDVILSGSATDVWIFQIAQTLDISNGKKVILSGGALAKNIFWQVAGQTTLGTTSVFNGTILDATAIVMNTGSTLNGRALAQTAVTLGDSTVTLDTTTPIVVLSTSAVVTNSAKLNVTSNSPSTCRYATTDINYDSMTNDLNTTWSSLSTNWSINGLSPSTTYTYFVQCRDGNNTDSNQVITFTTSAAPSTTNNGGGSSSVGGSLTNTTTTTTSATTLSETSNSYNPTTSEITTMLNGLRDSSGVGIYTTAEIAEIVANTSHYTFSKTIKVEEIKTIKNGVTSYSYRTTFTISVKNNNNTDSENVLVVEIIPKAIAASITAAQINSALEFTVLAADPVIQFTVPTITAGQTYTLTYSVDTNNKPNTNVNLASPVIGGETIVKATVTQPTDNTTTPVTNPTTQTTSPTAQVGTGLFGFGETGNLIVPVLLVGLVILIIAGYVVVRNKKKQ
ncbi:MAG: ice-binding family protein [archaeon]